MKKDLPLKQGSAKKQVLVAYGQRFALLFVLPLIVPVVWMLQTLSRYGVNVPYSDEWLIVPIFQRMEHGITLATFHDLWHAQNFHRLFFTQSIITIAANITDWNIHAEMYISFIFCLITASIVYLFVRRTIKSNLFALLAMLLAGFWLFSPVQSENWLWGWDVAWFICTAAAVVSIYLITRATGKYRYVFLTGAIAAGVVSIFSFGWGQAIWPVGLLLLLGQKQTKKPIIIWSISALVAYAAYYFHYAHSGPPVPVLAFLHEPINAICYLFVMFGRPYTYDLYAAMTLGAVSLLLLLPVSLLLWQRRKQLTPYLPWLGLIFFALIGAVMILLGRLVPDPHINTPLTDALQPRYTAMPIIYIVGMSGLLLTMVDRLKLSKNLVMYLVLTILIVQVPLVWSSYYAGQVKSKERYELMVKLQRCSHLPAYAIEKDCLSSNNYLSTQDTAKQQIEYLRSKHWASY